MLLVINANPLVSITLPLVIDTMTIVRMARLTPKTSKSVGFAQANGMEGKMWQVYSSR
jgi:hypothetical protein